MNIEFLEILIAFFYCFTTAIRNIFWFTTCEYKWWKQKLLRYSRIKPEAPQIRKFLVKDCQGNNFENLSYSILDSSNWRLLIMNEFTTLYYTSTRPSLTCYTNWCTNLSGPCTACRACIYGFWYPYIHERAFTILPSSQNSSSVRFSSRTLPWNVFFLFIMIAISLEQMELCNAIGGSCLNQEMSPLMDEERAKAIVAPSRK